MNKQPTPVTHVAESQHWYDHDGNPVYEVDSADGKRKVSPNKRHALKLKLLPGYSTVAACLSKPELEGWKRRQTLLAALTLARNAGEPDESFISRVKADAAAQAQQRAAEGTAIHKAIEQNLRGERYDLQWAAQVAKVRAVLDLLPRPFIGDFKTKETLTDKTDKELFFDDHIMQLSAYTAGLKNQVRRGERCASGTRPFETEQTFASSDGYGGRVDVLGGYDGDGQLPPTITLVSIFIGVKDCTVRQKIWTPDEAERGGDLFNHALAVWKLRNYDSAF